MRTALAFADDGRRPTRLDAMERATVLRRNHTGAAILIFVNEERGIAKVRLPNGSYVTVPIDELHVL